MNHRFGFFLQPEGLKLAGNTDNQQFTRYSPLFTQKTDKFSAPFARFATLMIICLRIPTVNLLWW
jgi:hypothetical protein